MHDVLFRAFFQGGRDLVDPAALQAALTGGEHTAAVLEDQRLAHALGISGVPECWCTAATAAGPGG